MFYSSFHDGPIVLPHKFTSVPHNQALSHSQQCYMICSNILGLSRPDKSTVKGEDEVNNGGQRSVA